MSDDPFELEVQRLFAQPAQLDDVAPFEADVLRRIDSYQTFRARFLAALIAFGVISGAVMLSVTGLLGAASRALSGWAQSTAVSGQTVGAGMLSVSPGVWAVLVLLGLTGLAAWGVISNRLT